MCTQVCDIIYYKDKLYPLQTDPLLEYWSERNPQPPIGLTKTSNYRGYVSTWEIMNKSLYLVEIVYRTPAGDAGLEYVFPNAKRRIKATWFTGELCIYLGNILDHFNDGFEQVYDSNWFITIEKGNIIGQRYKANY